MQEFTYLRPTTLAEALAQLQDFSSTARLFAGGTDLLIQLRNRDTESSHLIDIKAIPELSSGIRVGNGYISIGAATTMSDLIIDASVQKNFPALVDAASVVGSVQIRNRATIAGNICNASPAADTAPPLLVYGASVVACSLEGTRRIAISDFFVKSGVTTLKRQELVTAVEIPIPARRTGSAHVRRARRRGHDLASVTLCCGIEASGIVTLAYGSMGPKPILVVDKSGILADAKASEEAKSRIFESLFAGASPSKTSMRASPEYRLAMLRILGNRALTLASERLYGGGN